MGLLIFLWLERVPMLWALEMYPCNTIKKGPQKLSVQMGVRAWMGFFFSTLPSKIFKGIIIRAWGCAHLAVAQ